MDTINFPTNLNLDGALRATSNESPTDRSYLVQENLVACPVPLSSLVVWDAPGTHLPAAAAADDLGLVHAGINAAEIVKGVDAGATTETQYGRFDYVVPPEYVAGQSITIRINASMEVVADTSAVIDVECYRQAAPTVDICATAQQNMNSATPANFDFVLTVTSVVVGDVLKIRIKTVAVDAGDAAPLINAQIHSLTPKLDVKG